MLSKIYSTLIMFVLMMPGCTADDSRRSDDDADDKKERDAGSDAGKSPETDAGGYDDCADSVKLIYVVDGDRTLFSFNPPEKQFKMVGVIDCESGGNPYSMSVSRDGTAYVLYWDGSGGCVGINAVDIETAACIEQTPFQCDQLGISTFGMGFATDTAGGTKETLYIGTNTEPAKLASLDTNTWQITVRGQMSGTAEMTGNSNAELRGFFAWASPPHVSQINKSNGQESDTVNLSQLSTSASFAFAHWGGDYYLFHGPNQNTTVYRLSGGQIETYMPDTGYNIVGAGVSTCAPFVVE